jgi:hypothetical protein
MTALSTVSHDMARSPALKSSPVADQSQSRSLISFTTRLTGEQLEALRRCAKGISLRFEAWIVVNALVAGGYAENGVAGVVNVTAKGEEYLRIHAK